MMSETIGCEERMNDSEQQVHSWKWNQITRYPRLGLQGVDDVAEGRGFDARGRGQPRAELQEVAAGVAEQLRVFPDGERTAHGGAS